VSRVALTPRPQNPTFARMRLPRLAPLVGLPLICLFAAGCEPKVRSLDMGKNAAEIIGPVSVRIHPSFTQVKDWSGDGKPDGVEALFEVRDRWNEPIRATGRVLFELYEYRIGSPDPRGRRLVNPWAASLATVEEQTARWDRVSRAYKFQLAYPQADPARTYVLAASFETEGGRLFDRLNLGPDSE
jgi:hypothetical protein